MVKPNRIMGKGALFVFGILIFVGIFLLSNVGAVQYANCAAVPPAVRDEGGVTRTCLEVVSCANPLNPALSDSAHGRFRQSNTYYLLRNNISSNMTCIWYEADNSIFDLNEYTISFGDVSFDGLLNSDFEIAGATSTDALGWDFSLAPNADRVNDNLIHISNSYLVKFTSVSSPQTIISDWINIDFLQRSYEGYAIFDNCGTHSLSVESETKGVVCSTTSGYCNFIASASGRYRLRLTVDSGTCYVDLADIRPRYDMGIAIPASYIDTYAFPDYTTYSVRAPNSAYIKNGKIIESGHGSFFGKSIYRRLSSSGYVTVENMYTENKGMDSYNFFAVDGGSNTILRNNIFNNTNTYTTNRHMLMGPVGVNSNNNEIYGNKFFGGQGNLLLVGASNSIIYNNQFYNYMTAVTNHYFITNYGSDTTKIYNNSFEGSTPGILLSSESSSAETKNCEIYDNFMNLTAGSCDSEYPTTYSTSAFRITDYLSGRTLHNSIHDNVIYGKAAKDPRYPSCIPSIRGYHLSTSGINNSYANNYLNLSSDSQTTSIVVFGGGNQIGSFFNNTWIGNQWLTWLGNDYVAYSANAFFDSNKFIRLGSDSRFHTIVLGFWYSGSPSYSLNNTFLNNTFLNGASINDIFPYCSLRGHIADWFVKWYLNVNVLASGSPVAGQMVFVNSSYGSFSGITDAQGKIRFNLTEYYAYDSDAYRGEVLSFVRTNYTPYTVNVTYLGETKSQSVVLNETKTITFIFNAGMNSPDVNLDGLYNVVDLAIVVFNQGRAPTGNYAHLDLNSDGAINWADVQIVVGVI